MRVSPTEASDPVQILDTDGQVREGETVPDLSDDELLTMYREMRFARHFDRRTVSLQRQGRLGTYPPMAGQEAAQIGSAHALDPDDRVCYQYREHGVAFARGVDPADVLRYWQGHPDASGRLGDANVFPINIPIGSQIPHAVGMAWAAEYDDGPTPAVACHFGDGATSEGDFHEAMNFAGVFDTPNVFYCNNNGWAISVPRSRQTASNTIAEKATAYGFRGVQVDGMDPLAVYRVSRDALERARASEPEAPRPTLIEHLVYRYGAHTTADDPERYRDDEELERWRERDPIDRFERFLRETGRLDAEAIDAVEAAVEARMDEAVEAAEAEPAPDPAAMFEHAFAEPPPHVEGQRAYLDRLMERHGDGTLTK